MENYTPAEVTENYTPQVEESKPQVEESKPGQDSDAYFEIINRLTTITDRLITITDWSHSVDDRVQALADIINDRLTTITDTITDRFHSVDDRVQTIVDWVKDNNYFVHEIESFISDRFGRIEQLFGQKPPERVRVYLSYREVEDQLRVLAPSVIFRTRSDFNPEVNPTGRLSRLPSDARLIVGAELVNRVVPSKEWDQFLELLQGYPTTVWRDPRDRDGSNVDYIVLVLHPEGVIYIRMRAVE